MKKLLFIALIPSFSFANDCERMFEEIVFFKTTQEMCIIHSDLPLYDTLIDESQIYAESVKNKCGSNYSDYELNLAYQNAQQRVYARLSRLNVKTEKEFCRVIAPEYEKLQTKFAQY